MQRLVSHTLHEFFEALPSPSPPLPPPEKKNNPRLLKNEDPFQEMIPREKHKYQKLPLICFLTYKQHQKNNGLVYSSRLF